MKKIKSLIKNETGATIVEYGLIISIIALAITTVLLSFGETVDSTLDTVSAGMDSTRTP